MTIGVDLSSLQGAHRMRGIGYTLLNFINHISDEDKKQHSFIFYHYPINDINPDPMTLLNLNGLNYEVRELQHRRRINKRLSGKLGMITGIANQLLELKDLHFGDSRIKDLSGIDYFLQTDQSQSLPKRHRGSRLGLIIYDIIPFVLEWDYLWSYRVCRTRGMSRKASLRKHAHRWLYAYKIKINTRRANQLLSISERTKNDFIKNIGVKENKVIVTPLGVSEPNHKKSSPVMLRYESSSWGYLPVPLALDMTIPYLLFVGGADSRRKLDDLVSAFNMLRAQGTKLQLILVGDSMQGPNNIATDNIRTALSSSSYLNDIIFMGFADDSTRDWLYANALAFVFPSKYEGFGLPVLEAMIHGSTVISYENAATREVAANVPLYTDDVEGLVSAVRHLLSLSKADLNKIREKNVNHARTFDWAKTSHQIISSLK